jgi:pyruvate carboxylase
MRFLTEDPWGRLADIRQRVPNLLLQVLLRGANGVGYANYPDNVVRFFVQQSAKAGIDLFRVFDCLNWVEQMRVSMDAVLDSGKLLEAAICYTGDLLDPARAKYDLKYYLGLARELEKAGAHIIAVKDMGGLMKPAAARVLFKALREEVGTPIHFHTHDTSGLSAATVLASVEAGVDAVDAAMDSLSGLTSQPRSDRPSDRPRPRSDSPHLALLGSGALPVCRLREQPPFRRLGGLSARDAGRPVHQSQGTGARARSRKPLA